jgi:hypothetical protein
MWLGLDLDIADIARQREIGKTNLTPIYTDKC